MRGLILRRARDAADHLHVGQAAGAGRQQAHPHPGLEALAASASRRSGSSSGHHQEIRDAVGDGGRWGVRVTYIPQPARSGWRTPC